MESRRANWLTRYRPFAEGFAGRVQGLRPSQNWRHAHTMLIHQLPLDAAFATLRSTPAGLTRTEAASRRLEFGPNRIERLPSAPLAVRCLRQFTHFFAVLLWAAALLALIADWWMPG